MLGKTLQNILGLSKLQPTKATTEAREINIRCSGRWV